MKLPWLRREFCCGDVGVLKPRIRGGLLFPLLKSDKWIILDRCRGAKAGTEGQFVRTPQGLLWEKKSKSPHVQTTGALPEQNGAWAKIKDTMDLFSAWLTPGKHANQTGLKSVGRLKS